MSTDLVTNMALCSISESALVSSFPFEIWYHIVNYLLEDDPKDEILIDTWLDVRLSCKQLQLAVEAVYAEKVLPQIEIEFKVDSRNDYHDGLLERKIYTKNGITKGFTARLKDLVPSSCEINAEATNRSRAVFATDDFRIEVLYRSSKEERQVDTTKLQEEWEKDMRLYISDDNDRPGRFELTPHIVKLDGIVNDTELPALAINYTMRTVAFDWKLMLTKLFVEERDASDLLERAATPDSGAEQNDNGGGLNFMDWLEYERMAWSMDKCYSGMNNAPCQMGAANGALEPFRGSSVRIKGEEHATAPTPLLPPNSDPTLPAHTDGQLLRCPVIWRLYRDVYSNLSCIRHDFHTEVARAHWARRVAREVRIRRWYEQHERTKVNYDVDWVSQARILQRLRLVRLVRREELKLKTKVDSPDVEVLEWYSVPHKMPYYLVEEPREAAQEIIVHFSRRQDTEDYYHYGLAYDTEGCNIM